MLQRVFYINYAFSSLLSFLQLNIITCICYVYLEFNDVVFFTKTYSVPPPIGFINVNFIDI